MEQYGIEWQNRVRVFVGKSKVLQKEKLFYRQRWKVLRGLQK
jgi:hypothetical protein